MSFARDQQPFSNQNTSCIHCGICVTVCPLDVLSFDNNGQGTVSLRLFGPKSGIAVTVKGEAVGSLRS